MYRSDQFENFIRQRCASISAQPTSALNPAGRRPGTLIGGFGCKICGRKFGSFQALGGHVSSHAKHTQDHLPAAQHHPAFPNSKAHECSICKIRFPTGQALGGHMRRHSVLAAKHNRDDHDADADADQQNKKIKKTSFFKEEQEEVKTVPFFNKGGLLLDLNFPPPLE